MEKKYFCLHNYFRTLFDSLFYLSRIAWIYKILYLFIHFCVVPTSIYQSNTFGVMISSILFSLLILYKIHCARCLFMAVFYKCGSSLGKMLHFREKDAQTNLKISLILQWLLHNLIYSWKKSNGKGLWFCRNRQTTGNMIIYIPYKSSCCASLAVCLSPSFKVNYEKAG